MQGFCTKVWWIIPCLHLFFSFLLEDVSSYMLIPFFKPGSVHSGSVSWDDCGTAFPYNSHESLFPDKPITINHIPLTPSYIMAKSQAQTRTRTKFYLFSAERGLTGSSTQLTTRGRQTVDGSQGATDVDVELASIGWVTVIQHHPVLSWCWLGQATHTHRKYVHMKVKLDALLTTKS